MKKEEEEGKKESYEHKGYKGMRQKKLFKKF